jgi:hypothetical protein
MSLKKRYLLYDSYLRKETEPLSETLFLFLYFETLDHGQSPKIKWL